MQWNRQLQTSTLFQCVPWTNHAEKMMSPVLYFVQLDDAYCEKEGLSGRSGMNSSRYKISTPACNFFP